MSLFIIIPAYNEARTISKIIDDVKRYSSNIVVVDDGSSDDTQKAAKDVTVLKHLTNMGKGAAMKTGVEYAIKKNAKQIVFIDADGQHEAKEIPHFLEALKDVDVVFGYRELNKKMPLILKLGNWVINRSIKLLYNLELKDTQCGYRAFNTNVYNKIKWKALDYSVESEIIANTGKNKLKYKEIPIKTIYNSLISIRNII